VSVEERLTKLGRALCEREAAHSEELEEARQRAAALHSMLGKLLDTYHATVLPEAPQLGLSLDEPRLDDKHLHAVQFQLSRGRHRALVVVKSRGDVTLVGPFHQGKTEGPCESHAWDAASDIETALGDLLVKFIEGAMTT